MKISIAKFCSYFFYNEAHTVGLAYSPKASELSSSEIHFEQERTCADGNGNKQSQRRPFSSPYALVWCVSYVIRCYLEESYQF
jgi:hypothetical protein